MASEYPDMPREPRPLRTALIVAGLAFLAGLAAMAWMLTRWEPARRFLQPGRVVTTAVVPASTPRMAAPVPSAIIEGTPGASIDAVRMADIEARMARVDLRAAAAAGNAARAEGLLVAFAARRAIDRGVALGYIEGELRARFGASQPRAVASIIAGSQAPVTLAGLQLGLDTLRPKLTGAVANEGWWLATKRTLSGLVVVRKQGTTSPAPDERLARARLQLESGQVEGALAEVARMPGRASAGDWMAQARRYIEAHRALDLIEAAALTDRDPQTGL